MKNGILMFCLLFMLAGCALQPNKDKYVSLSGVYPHLAYYNNEGECGTGAVVPWAGRLWVMTYGPHLPKGSSDKLYEITPDLDLMIRKESVGGTPANRMIHRESNQLFMGPYAIGDTGRVRVIPYSEMPGRHTGNARHLTDPSGKIYYATMEEGFYEVDVNTLAVKELYRDGNFIPQGQGGAGPLNALLPGVHGKGLYSGQGVLVFSNNGEGSVEALRRFDVEAGVLAEWDGKDWKVVRRNQFTEVTGPGGIDGNRKPETDPIWATGWDHKSLLLGVRDVAKGWMFYRLPKASHTYDGAHGWNTEWPRIRNVGAVDSADYLMTMHGMFWRFPGSFSVGNAYGVRPRSAYLKVIGDFTRWGDRLVFGCDDAAKNEFLNKRRAKGGIGGPGQSHSNLWFTSATEPDMLGPATAEGMVWSQEDVKAGVCSDPFLFAGWPSRMCWMKNGGEKNTEFIFEVDEKGIGDWKECGRVQVAPGKSGQMVFDTNAKGEWIRVKTDVSTTATVCFNYTSKDGREAAADKIFDGLSPVGNEKALNGLLYALGNNRRTLGVLALEEGQKPGRYYELNERLELEQKDDSATSRHMSERFSIPKQVVAVEQASVLIVDDKGRRWRLPFGNDAFTALTDGAELRICREVSTERDLFHCHGTFYELPAENADGYAKIRPVASHDFRICDYTSYRGLLVMTGIDPQAGKGNKHVIVSQDGRAAVWAGVIDDLWKLGKPRGKGGPWKDTDVKAMVPSDPYLIGFYDEKTLTLSHNGSGTVNFTIELDPAGNGEFMEYATYPVTAGEKRTVELPASLQARWIRFVADADVTATAWLEYK